MFRYFTIVIVLKNIWLWYLPAPLGNDHLGADVMEAPPEVPVEESRLACRRLGLRAQTVLCGKRTCQSGLFATIL